VDSSLIRFAMFLIASAACSGVISLMLAAVPTLLLFAVVSDIETNMMSFYKRRAIAISF
jgi:hypothetical protein